MTQPGDLTQDSEAELVGIQDALQGLALDSAPNSSEAARQAAGSHGPELLPGKDGQDRVVDLLKTFVGEVWMTAFTFDEPSIVKALKDHLDQGSGRVCILVDEEMSRKPLATNEVKTKNQHNVQNELAAAGAKCQLVKGKDRTPEYGAINRRIGGTFIGHQHSKTIYLKGEPGKTSYLLVGSSNWTTSSRANIELGMLVRDVSGSKIFSDYEEFYEGLWKEGKPFKQDVRPQVDAMKLAA